MERQLEAFRSRALEMKQKVDPAVSARVLADYDARLHALRAEAEPLRARARSEWERLRPLYTEVGDREKRAQLDKQESEFRHEVGEIEKAELRERVEACETVLETCRADTAVLDRQKARFLEVFTEAELTAAPPAAPEPARADTAVTATGTMASRPPAPETTGAPTMMADPRSIRVEVAAAASDATVFAAADEPDATMLGPRPVLVDDTEEEGTLILPEGVLVVIDANGGEASHRLSAMAYLGRSDDNQIRVYGGGVSRRHALVVAERTGFRIEDLGSQNGTLVNGKPVQRAVLAHGDIIALGDATLRFELPAARHA
ncbi:MAG: FHA domain-containing protein [Vicinamibacterales bacterium]